MARNDLTSGEPPYTEVRFTLPYSLPFEGEFGFEWADDTFWVTVKNVQVFDRRSEEVIGLRFATSGGGSISVRGPHGLSHLAEVVVRFHAQFELPAPVESAPPAPDSDRAREHACEAVNRVIEVYRESSDDFRVRRVMPQHDVISFEVERVETGGGGTQGFRMGSGSKLLYPIKVRDFAQARAGIDQLLQAKVSIPIYRDYIHAARRFFEEREFALAVVLANAALELVWAESLREGLVDQGCASQETKRLMDKWTRPTTNKRTLPLLDEGLRQVFGRSLQSDNSELWGEVNEARKLRKNVVHPWPKRPKANETLKAMIAIEQVLSWLARVVSSDEESETLGEGRSRER